MSRPRAVAGVSHIIGAAPPREGKGIFPPTLYALAESGADEIYAIGGVQAFAAMAFGRVGMKPVDMITGPGNAYVAEAKRQLFGQVGIDLPAGPTEILVIADETSDPALVATDLLGQAEHGPDSPAWLISTSEKVAREVLAEIERQLVTLPTREIAGAAWARWGEVAVVDSDDEAIALSDQYAPEHLEVLTSKNDYYLKQLTQLRQPVRRRGKHGRLRRQGRRHQSYAADRTRRALHRRALGRKVPEDRDLSTADPGSEPRDCADHRPHVRGRRHARARDHGDRARRPLCAAPPERGRIMHKPLDTKWAVTPEAAISAVRDVASGHGKLEIVSKVHVSSLRDIATLYTPGVGVLVQRIVANAEEVETLSNRGNTIAVVTDGTAVLGFGRTGPLPAVPVMEGKAIMFKMLAGLDAVPLCLDVKDPDKLADHIVALEPSFAGFNIEDVAAPHCFSTMSALTERMSVPVFHDDQYGTATVIVAGLMNAIRVVGKKKEDIRIVVNGAGAAGTAAAKLLLAWGVGEIIICDKHGIIVSTERQPFPHMDELASRTNRAKKTGDLRDALRGADAFVGLSTGNLLSRPHIQSMAKDAIVFACANPEPEIMPSAALAAGAAISGSGRFDEPNQCNNVLAFPGIMRGAVDTAAKRITETICLAASRAIAGRVQENELKFDNVLPSPLDPDLCPAVAEAVARQAMAEGLARKHRAPGEIAAGVRERCSFGAAQQAFLTVIQEQYCRNNGSLIIRV